MGAAYRAANADEIAPIVPDDLLVHLDAAQLASYPGSGTTWFDLSGNGLDFTAYGGVDFVATHGGGFNTANPRYWQRSAGLEAAYSGGISGFVWSTNPAFQTSMMLLGRADWNNSNGWNLWQQVGPSMMGPRYFGAQGASNAGTGSSSTNYLGFTLDNLGNAKIYVNGVQSGSTAPGIELPAASGATRIGCYTPGGFHFAGAIHAVHIYERGLSGAEVLANFNATKARYGL